MARDQTALEAVAQTCRLGGAEVMVFPMDVSDPAAAERLVKETVTVFGGIDVLVNNAGIDMIARFDEVTDLSIFERLMRVNYLGSVYPTYFALPELKKSRGLIVAVSSLAGLTGVPTRTGYAATKHAQFGFFDSLRVELHGTGVGVTMIAPDFVVSEIHKRALTSDGSPRGHTAVDESRVMTAEEAAGEILDAMVKRQRLRILSLRGKAGRFVRLVFPEFIDGLARRAVEKGT